MTEPLVKRLRNMANEPGTSRSAAELMFEAAGEIDWLTRELACPAPAASPVMSSTYGGNPYPIPAEKPASTVVPPAPAFDTDLREYVRVVTQEDIGKHCINVSDGRWLLVEIDRLNKLVADLTNSLKETREALVNRDETCERLIRELAEAFDGVLVTMTPELRALRHLRRCIATPKGTPIDWIAVEDALHDSAQSESAKKGPGDE